MKTTRHPAVSPSGAPPAWLSDLRRNALGHLLAAACGVFAASLWMVGSGEVGANHTVKALALFSAGAWLVWRGLGIAQAHPHPRFGPANGVTLTRLALVVLLAALVGEAVARPPLGSMPAAAWAIVIVATLTALLDAVDGHLARRSGMASRFGARFDMETDAFFTLVLCALVVQAGQAGPWLLASGLMRYAFVGAAGLWPWLSADLPPSRRRQAVCVVQITTLIVCLGPIVPPELATALAALSLALLAASFAIDILALSRQRPRSQER